MDYDEDSKKSRFNAGIAQTERMDALQRAIIQAKFNPLMRNMETGTYNYENLLPAADSMIDEAWGKLNEKERALTLRMYNVLYNLNKYFPPVSLNRKNEPQINKVNYERYISFFGLLHRKLKDLYDIHELNSPSKEVDDGNYDY